MMLTKIIAYCKVLTQLEAQLRYKQIQPTSVKYSFYLRLDPGSSYQGMAQIGFKIAPKLESEEKLLIDFQGKHVTSISINGLQLAKYEQYVDQGAIRIPFGLLQKGQTNYASIGYWNEYDSDGSGCVSFIDVDDKQYLYTQLQPWMGSRVFPLFDQPDIKASMKLAIACPSLWPTVISNQEVSNTVLMHNNPILPLQHDQPTPQLTSFLQSLPSQYKLTYFHATPVLSCYLYCFVVGPYQQLICRNTYRNIPMSLYCIASLYPYLQNHLAPFIQEITNQSFRFFQQYFNSQYPFTKYDQVFAHEYKWGAMENAGIVTLNDHLLFRQKVSTEKMMMLGNTIVHELAHHWFGNWVTMKWWEDLWLNESFAQYISHFCMEKIKHKLTTLKYQSAMLSFFNRKEWGYTEDQMVTTHSICSQVKDTSVAQSIFDGITYSKGAAVLKQLMYLMGQDNFSSALTSYFQKYAFGNAELADLLNCMIPYYDEDTIGVSLQLWKQMWLQKAGLNQLSCVWENNTITITQKVVRNEHPTLRVHRIRIALFDEHNVIHPIEVTINAKQTTIVSYQQCLNPQAIFLNLDDLSFVKVSLDTRSLAWLGAHIGQISDTLLRAMIWRSLFAMVKDAELSTDDYCKFVLHNISAQKSDVILQQQLMYLLQCIRQYTPYQFRDELYGKTYSTIKNMLGQDGVHSNKKIILSNKLIQTGQLETHKAELLQILQGKQQVTWQPNMQQNWKMIAKVFTMSTIAPHHKQQVFNRQKSNDNSDRMINMRHHCDALISSGQQLQALYKSILTADLSMSNYIKTMTGLNNPVHLQDINQKYSDQYFKKVSDLLEDNRIGDKLQLLVMYMAPINDGNVDKLRQNISKYQNIIKQHEHHNHKIINIIRKIVDKSYQRCKAYQKFNSTKTQSANTML